MLDNVRYSSLIMMTSREKQIKSAARKAGFHVAGNFIVVFRSEDVISGMVIDVAPSTTYLWIFILPMYDDLPFLHMTLGDRVAVCDGQNDCFSKAYEDYRQKLGDVKLASDVVAYLDENGIEGDYSRWVRYLSLIRTGDFTAAEEYLVKFPELSTLRLSREKLDKIKLVQACNGWPGVQRLLDEWADGNAHLI